MKARCLTLKKSLAYFSLPLCK